MTGPAVTGPAVSGPGSPRAAALEHAPPAREAQTSGHDGVSGGRGAGLRLLLAASRLHIVLIALLGTVTFAWLFTGIQAWGLGLIAALDWLILDLGNKLSDLPEDRVNNPREAAWVARHARAIAASITAGFALTIIWTALTSPALIAARLLFQAGGVAYNFRILPGRRRLKQLYAVKNAAAAALFVISVAGYPLVALWPQVTVGWPYVLLICGFFFFFEMSFEVIYDFKDIVGDRIAGVATYPAIHGERRARQIFGAFVLAATLILLGGHLFAITGFKELIMLLAPAVQAAVFTPFSRRGYRASDTVLITHAGSAQLAIYNLYVLAGLPFPQ